MKRHYHSTAENKSVLTIRTIVRGPSNSLKIVSSDQNKRRSFIRHPSNLLSKKTSITPLVDQNFTNRIDSVSSELIHVYQK